MNNFLFTVIDTQLMSVDADITVGINYILLYNLIVFDFFTL